MMQPAFDSPVIPVGFLQRLRAPSHTGVAGDQKFILQLVAFLIRAIRRP